MSWRCFCLELFTWCNLLNTTSKHMFSTRDDPNWHITWSSSGFSTQSRLLWTTVQTEKHLCISLTCLQSKSSLFSLLPSDINNILVNVHALTEEFLLFLQSIHIKHEMQFFLQNTIELFQTILLHCLSAWEVNANQALWRYTCNA